MVPLNVENVLLLVRDFIVLWILQILRHNTIYPESTFEQRSYHDLLVYQSRVDPLTTFLSEFSNEIISVLARRGDSGGKVYDINVLIYNESNNHVTRRYVLGFSQFVGLGDKVTLLEFLKGQHVDLAAIKIPNFTWENLNTHYRSLMFFHSEELKREHVKGDYFFKLLINTEDTINPGSDWVKLLSDIDDRDTKFVNLGEMSVGVVAIDMHNEYCSD